MLSVYTSRLGHYRGPDLLDITVKSGSRSRLDGIPGSIFAPTWELVMGYKQGSITPADYTAAYTQLMRRSFVRHRELWRRLLAQERVVLACYCPPRSFCHRLVLADILVKCGAVYCGEV